MVGDYISREAAIELFEQAFDNNWEVSGTLDRLRAIPAADVVERKSGVWIWDDEGYHCSECFFHAYGSTAEILSGDYHFCPHCGARCDGEHEPPKEEA